MQIGSLPAEPNWLWQEAEEACLRTLRAICFLIIAVAQIIDEIANVKSSWKLHQWFQDAERKSILFIYQQKHEMPLFPECVLTSKKTEMHPRNCPNSGM